MRRYLFKLYPNQTQSATLHEQRMMMADLWNALLQRYEDITRRTQQRQTWYDKEGKRHVGVTVHNPRWETIRKAHGERAVIEPQKDGRPKAFTQFDMQNEVTYLYNVDPEWRKMSVWCGHRTATKLSLAIEAFYSRAAKGAGAQSGYPRYRRRVAQVGIPHRFASGCRLTKDPRHALSWSARLKGIDGHIHARGCFPSQIEEWADADVLWRDGHWWLSVCVDVQPRRHAGHQLVVVRFDLIDCFAQVNGLPTWLPMFGDMLTLQDQIAERQSAKDRRWPHGRRRDPREQAEYIEEVAAISALSSRLARQRRDALHVWSTHVVETASDLTVIAPPVRERTASPHGDEKHHGAAVESVSEINRHILAQAPSTAVAMLKYKAEEAGIKCHIVVDESPKIVVGNELVVAGKVQRVARRRLKKAA